MTASMKAALVCTIPCVIAAVFLSYMLAVIAIAYYSPAPSHEANLSRMLREAGEGCRSGQYNCRAYVATEPKP